MAFSMWVICFTLIYLYAWGLVKIDTTYQSNAVGRILKIPVPRFQTLIPISCEYYACGYIMLYGTVEFKIG